MTAEKLTTFVTATRLRALAGDRVFIRGEAYCAEGRVHSLRCEGKNLKAQVRGAHPYQVKMRLKEGALDYSCTCPQGEEDAFCKHCVAVGLSLIAQAGAASEPASDIEAYLRGLQMEELIGIVLACADEDKNLHRRLLLRASHKAPHKPDLTVWKQAFDNAVGGGDYIEYGEMGGYVSGIAEVVDSAEELLEAGEAISFAEHALEALEDAMGNVDDSEGELGALICRLQDFHLAACRKAPPDPEALARRLFEWELLGEWDVFHDAASTYADVLGEAGMAVYCRLAEVEWKKMPALKPGDRDDRSGKRFNITNIMEALTRQSGDLDALIEVKRRDLSLPYGFLQIAMLCKEAGRPDEALAWAERGWVAFKGSDVRLRTFLADAYRDRGRHEQAIALAWEGFCAGPDLESYRALHGYAICGGAWPGWRDKALVRLREQMMPRKKAPSSRLAPWMVRDRSLLVEIFLWEKKSDEAWQEAKQGGCSGRLWLQLAEQREKTHPRDAIDIYKERTAETLKQASDHAYATALQLLRKIRRLLAGLGEEDSFRGYLAALRAAHARKRNFLKLLDRDRW